MTIEELCSRYWPDGCDYFFIVESDAQGRDGRWFGPAFYSDVKNWSHDSDFPYRVDNGLSVCIIPIIACVAAMHWENKARSLSEIDDVANAFKAADAWSELAKGV